MNEELRARIRCPYCGSEDTELFSLFGQQLLTVQYYCRSCLTPFERVRGPDVIADAEENVLNRPSNP
ncbi:MAG TPA: hypothetical protein VF221_16570 [Chloroflexota bacterium]